uniref:Uncharacterized protein n=1 Tax=Arundo donax TaxID=35708 RepID=A0A0A9ACF3_ARUDO
MWLPGFSRPMFYAQHTADN